MQANENAPEWLFPFFAVAFPLFWCSVCYLVSVISGWHRLAETWRANDIFRGEKMRFCSANLRWGAHYGSCLTLGSDHFGLSMTVLFPFRAGHPPLFVPWEAISISPERRGVLFKKTGLQLGRETGVTFWLFEGTARRLLSRQNRLHLSGLP